MSLFGRLLVLFGRLNDFVFLAIQAKLISQLYVLWAAAIVGALYSIWYSNNRYLHAQISFGHAFGFTSCAIKKANVSNNGSRFNKVDDLFIFAESQGQVVTF